MSGSESGGLMNSREPYGGLGLQNSPPGQPQGMMHNMGLRLQFPETAIYSHSQSPENGGGNGGGGGGELSMGTSHGLINMNLVGTQEGAVKKKRGRPRKYGPDGSIGLSLIPATPVAMVASVSTGGGAFSPLPSGGSFSPSKSKKARGRPVGSGRKRQMDAYGSTGAGFTPHVITVTAGEDVSSKILSFSQQGPRAVCILSANGDIANVTLRHPATSGGTVSYEGRFEILSLSGSFLLMEKDGQRSRSGGLSICLAGSDGRILGGSVAGILVAASPVQVMMASFIADSSKEPKAMYPTETMLAPPNLTPRAATTCGSSPSRGTMSESSGGPSSPINRSHNNSNPQAMIWN